MNRVFKFLALLSVALAGMATAETVSAASPCESLTSFKLSGGIVTSAKLVEAGQFTPPASPQGGGRGQQAAAMAMYAKLPPFCQVDATLTPSADSSIHIEVWLPAEGWNGKLVEAGNGSFSSAFGYGPMAQYLLKRYASTSSDTGHTGDTADFAVGHPEKIIDFGYRAVHENAMAAKAIATAFYGVALKQAYFDGCSSGGRQAYGEAQRYPDDFNGIIAGAPGIEFTHQTGAELLTIKWIHNHPDAVIPKEKLAVLHNAVIAACDQIDGVKDGVLENPLQCKYDPKKLLCKSGDAPDCLTAPQVQLAELIYKGATFSDGKQIYPGSVRGTENGWGNILIRTDPMEYGLDSYRDVILQDPKWDYLTLDADKDIPAADKSVGGIVNNFDPNLKPFFVRGNKLLGYQGWADPQNSVINHILYHQMVIAAVGAKTGANDYRLFMVPGMGHCGGGDGTTTFDLLSALDNWVTTGKAPDSILASRVVDNQVVRTRPLCPYPQQAVYKGTGSTDDAANFSCAVKK